MMRFHVCAFLIVPLLALGLGGCRETAEPRLPGAEFQILAIRKAVSKILLPEDVLPYDDGLVWHEYEVKKVWYGELPAGTKTIRVAHWSVVGSDPLPVDQKLEEEVVLHLSPFDDSPALQDVAQSDDLAFDDAPPRFLDLEQTLAVDETPESLRMDYSGTISQQMTLYWKLRPQLRVVAMGNSLITKGICPGMMLLPDNQKTPVALNLAPAGANNTLQCLMLREYVLPLPKLEWVVWGITPRVFNASRTAADDRKMDDFMASPGRNYDVDNKATLWPVPAGDGPLVTTEELGQLGITKFDLWGWEGRKRTDVPPLHHKKALRAYVEGNVRAPDFVWDEPEWTQFVETLKLLNARGIKVLLITLPMHPLLNDMPAADPDGTSDASKAEMVLRLEALDKELPLAWFQDHHRAGQHDYTPDEFYDLDHLNRKGAVKFTQRIVDWMSTQSKPPVPVTSEAPAPASD
jgi:hypothetical protein